MRVLSRLFTAAAAATLLTTAAAPTEAAAQSTSFWYWSGNCVDCAVANSTSTYSVTGILELFGYMGGELNNNHFVSFSYSGSNLMDPYTVYPGIEFDEESSPFAALVVPVGWTHVFGGIQGNLDNNTLRLDFGDGLVFQVFGNGEWFTCGAKGSVYYATSCDVLNNNDFGNQGAFSTTPPSTTVPEPSTYALMAAGLGALLVVRRRRAAA